MFQLKYSSIIDDLQKDTDEEELSEKESNVELPVQVDTHFKKFNIKYRKAESKEEVNPRNTRQKKCPDPDFGWPDPDTFRVYHFKKFRSQSEARE